MGFTIKSILGGPRRREKAGRHDRGNLSRASRRTTIPLCSSPCVPKPRRWRSPPPSRAAGRRASRCSASRSSSRTISTSRACRRPAACPAFAYAPERSAFVVERLERAGAIVIGKTNLDQFATGLVGVRSPYGDSAQCVERRSHSRRLQRGLGDGGRRRIDAVLAWHRYGGLGPGPRRAQRHRRIEAFARRAVDDRRRARLPDARHGLDIRARRRRRLSRLWRRRRLRRGGPLVAGVPGADAFGAAGPFQGRRSQNPSSESSSATAPRRRRSIAMSPSLEALGGKIVEFDMEPFYAVARLLYEGPWVAERYAATKPLIETNPEALHPVTRAIIEGARKHDAVAAFEAMYKLAALAARDRKRLGAFRRDGRADHAAPLHDRGSGSRSDRAQFKSRDLYQFRQSARSLRDRGARRHAGGRSALACDVDRPRRR